MIKNIKINNFQSHKNTDIQFHEGVNIIVGESDSGKSAILRALRWLVYGKPRGDGFRSHWGGDTEVSIEVDNYNIARIKTNSDNLYILKNKDTDEVLEFRAIGTDIPAEIIKVLNLKEGNLQQQLDRPFLISETPGEVASHFNRMAKLEKIDIGLKNIQSKIRSTDQEILYKTEQLKKDKEEYLSYSYIKEAEEDIVVLEDQVKQKKELTSGITNISVLIEDIERYEYKIEKDFGYLVCEKDINKLIEISHMITEKEAEAEELENMIYNIEGIKEGIDNIRTIVGADIDLSLIEEKQKILKDNKKDLQGIEESINLIESISNCIIKKIKDNKQLEKEWEENMPDVCPLCEK